MKTKLCGIVLALAGLTSSFGCATQTTEEVVAEAEALTLAEVELESGSVYEFFSLGEGDLAVLTRHPSIAIAREAPSRASDERLVDFYTRLTGQDAPTALAVAEARAIELGAELASADLDLEGDVAGLDGAAPTDAVTRVDGDVGSASQALTWSEFEDTYCRSGADYLFCFPSTGNAWCEKRGLTMEGAVHAKGGGVTIRLRYKTITGWHTYKQLWVPKGEVNSIANAYFLARRWRRFEVLNNDVDQDYLYFSCRGTN